MRMSPAWVRQALSQFEAEVIPERDPVMARLTLLFGEHTFFLAPNGLNIVEPFAPREPGVLFGKVINLANWTDDNTSSLVPREPEVTEVVVEFIGDEDAIDYHLSMNERR